MNWNMKDKDKIKH